MRQHRKIVEYTWTRVKKNSKLINFQKYHELYSMAVNNGRIHGQIRYFQGISSNSLKMDDKLR